MTSINNEQLNVKSKSSTSVIFNDVTNDTQFCYHLIYPRNFYLTKRPKRVAQTNGGTIANKRRRRGRPRKDETKKTEDERRTQDVIVSEKKLNEHKMPCSRTRSGRVSRPPKHMSKFVDIKDSRMVNTVPMPIDAPNSNAIVTDIPAIEFNGGIDCAMELPAELLTEQPIAVVPETKKVRKNLARYTCSVCKKVVILIAIQGNRVI